jgi:small subunit ribosomal protein S15
MLEKNMKDAIIAKYATHKNDTGSPQVQIALLTAEIKDLTQHLVAHKKDFSSRRGLMRKVSERRRLMKYMKREDAKGYEELVKSLGLA